MGTSLISWTRKLLIWSTYGLGAVIIATLIFPALAQTIYGACGVSLVKFEALRTFPLNTPELKIVRQVDGVYTTDLTVLNLASISDDSARHEMSSPINLLEDGKPLLPHVIPSAMRQGTHGSFSHLGNTLYFSPSNLDPAEKHLYTLIYPELTDGYQKTLLDTQRLILPYLIVAAILCSLAMLILAAQNFKLLNTTILATLGAALLHNVVWVNSQTIWGPVGWDAFVYGVDSELWMAPYGPDSTRPPVFPTFVNTILKLTKDTSAPLNLKLLPVNVRVTDQPNNPLLVIARAQKLVFLFSVLMFAVICSRLIPSPIIAVAVLWIFSNVYFPYEFDSMLSETLAQSWMFLTAACFALCIYRPKPRYLATLGIAVALLFHTRSSGAFGFAMFGLAALWVTLISIRKQARGKKFCLSEWLYLASACAIFVALIGAPSVYRYFKTGFMSAAPMYADAQIAFALQVATPHDRRLVPEGVQREFLRQALKLRDEKHAWARSVVKVTSPLQLLGLNLYHVAHPIADNLKLDNVERRKTYSAVATPILKKHWRGYFEMFSESFGISVNEMTRLGRPPFPKFSILLLILAAGCIFAFSKESIIAFGLVSAHLAHLVIICLFDVPQARYVYASEFLVILAIMFLLIGALKRVQFFGATIASYIRKSGFLLVEQPSKPGTIVNEDRLISSIELKKSRVENG